MADRKLSKAEEKRLLVFDEINKSYKDEGYKVIKLTASLVKANLMGMVYGLVVSIPFIILFNLNYNAEQNDLITFFNEFNLYFLWMIILIVVHELLHGLTWSIFAKKHLKAISFGFILKSLNPYCTCNEPLKRNEYIIGLLMPLIVLGLIPSFISIFTHNSGLLFLGVMMILGAGGDLLIFKLILDYKDKGTSLYLDHPTDIGLVVFEK